MKIRIKAVPCHWCNSKTETLYDTELGHQVVCGKYECGATGPYYEAEEGAIEKWNAIKVTQTSKDYISLLNKYDEMRSFFHQYLTDDWYLDKAPNDTKKAVHKFLDKIDKKHPLRLAE